METDPKTEQEINDLATRLIKLLEQKHNKPIELRADTPESVKMVRGYEVGYFGAFGNRRITVERVKDLGKEYIDDVALIEGNYSSLKELQQKAYNLNLLYEAPSPGTIVDEAFNLVEKEVGKQLMCNNLATNFEEGLFNKLSKRKIEKILRGYGYQFFAHNIEVRPDGVYDQRTGGGTLCVVDETLVAKVIIQKL
jgi:hypothetical protein